MVVGVPNGPDQDRIPRSEPESKPTDLVELVDAVIFDFGGVLTTSPTSIMAAQAAKIGLSLAEVMPLMIGPLDRDGDHPWHRIERGEITLVDFHTEMERVFAEAGYQSFVVPPAKSEVMAALIPVPEMMAAVDRTRAAGYRTAILSNNIREWSGWQDLINAHEIVDVVIDSCEVGLRKPDPAIFKLTADRLGPVPVDRCLMVDDFAWNIAGAASMGMHTFEVTDPAGQADELCRLVGV
jgi:epoxide hydrolase-like predicted phosphatase